jgi:hypothetical protein
MANEAGERVKTLLDIWDRRAKHPEKAPEKPARPEWLGEHPEAPTVDEVRAKLTAQRTASTTPEAKPKPVPQLKPVQAINVLDEVYAAIRTFVRNEVIPDINKTVIERVEECMADHAEVLQSAEQALKTVNEFTPVLSEHVTTFKGQTANYTSLIQERDTLRQQNIQLAAAVAEERRARMDAETLAAKQRDEYVERYTRIQAAIAAAQPDVLSATSAALSVNKPAA